MEIKKMLEYIWKIPLTAALMTAGVVIGGMVPTLLGIPSPSMPEGVEMNTLFLHYLIGNMVLALALSFIAGGIGGKFWSRWTILALFAWLALTSMSIESGIYMAEEGMGGASAALFNALSQIPPSLIGAGLLAALFRPRDSERLLTNALSEFLSKRPIQEWSWRIGLALVAYPAIYLFFGFLVIPFTYSFYAEGAFGLAAPTWGQVIPVQIARSLLLLVGCLPVLAAWERSGRELYFSVGLSLWVLIGLMWTLMSYWMAPGMRLVHTLEVFADAMLYAAVLISLLSKGRARGRSFQTVTP